MNNSNRENIAISSIIVAKNEEKNIKRCIESQVGIVDEIILIVDSGTTDNTLQIASAYKDVKCEVTDWKGYSGTKKYALSKTTNDWILWVDADEELTDELRNELQNFKQTIPLHNAYNIARRAFFLGKWIKHSGWYPGYVTRLFNKNFTRFDDKDVHENLTIDGSVGKLKSDLNHYTDPTIEHYLNKFNHYTTLAAAQLDKQNRKASVIDILFRPLFLFVKMYIFRIGFLDGLHGFILAIFSSAYVFTKYTKLWELNRKKK